MAPISTFYLSPLLGKKVTDSHQNTIGKLQDLIVDDVNFIRPKVVAARIKHGKKSRIIDFNQFHITREHGHFSMNLTDVQDAEFVDEDTLPLAKYVLDKQIVDIDGRKVVRVNDLRFAVLSTGTYVVAVDVGIEGLLRRLGIYRPIKAFLGIFGGNLHSEHITWDEVETIDFSHMGLRLAKPSAKLSTLHPSDLADIIEDLDHKSQAALFASLEQEHAADVLEELEPDVQVHMMESMNPSEAANVLEKMPVDEVADLLDELDSETATKLLHEMEKETSDEIRELMDYHDNEVGSIMITDFVSFSDKMTVDETLLELRRIKPEADIINYLYVQDKENHLTAVVSLRDIVVSEPAVPLSSIMDDQVVFVKDTDRIDTLAELLTKYSLLALPVVDENMIMVGIGMIDDVVAKLLKTRRRRN